MFELNCCLAQLLEAAKEGSQSQLDSSSIRDIPSSMLIPATSVRTRLGFMFLVFFQFIFPAAEEQEEIGNLTPSSSHHNLAAADEPL